MEPRNLNDITRGCGGKLLKGSPESIVTGVCNDSKSLSKGNLFFALSGERFDAHDFLAEVDAKGAGAVVIDEARFPLQNNLNCGIIGVKNPRTALGKLGASYRDDYSLPVICVGGSNGKTSTKELIASVLRQKLNTLWSEASYNNDVGVPATLLKLESCHQVAVLEVGTNHPGELKPLVEMVRPRYGVITSIGREHLEFFGDLAGVEKEEGALAEALPEDGVLFVHGDDSWAERMQNRTRARVVRVGTGARNDWRVVGFRMDSTGASFELQASRNDFSGEYRIHLLGRHQVINSLFAIAIGAELGLDAELIRAGLVLCKPAKMRLQTWNWNGVFVIDDAYNANADSMRAALETLREFPCNGRRVAVLGDMAELGVQSIAAHQEVGQMTADCGVDRLFAVGKMSGHMADAATRSGLKDVSPYPDASSVGEALKIFLKPGDVLLLKASRSSRLERVMEIFKDAGNGGKS
jgi:UDP-N-acetylmuramoyl-tripeptide--D-alanyl-D-alanine ligase